MNMVNDSSKEDSPRSKSQKKRDMQALQELGKHLCELKTEQLKKLSLTVTLFAAIEEFKRLTSNGAKRRQMQYIGKLMREEDAEAISQELAHFEQQHQKTSGAFHALEKWRDKLITEGKPALTEYLSMHPGVDVQHLRHLIQAAVKETQLQRSIGAGRALFRFLREVQETTGD